MKTEERIQHRLETCRFDLELAKRLYAHSNYLTDRDHILELKTKISVLEWVLGIQ
jgi:hypothetical protein